MKKMLSVEKGTFAIVMVFILTLSLCSCNGYKKSNRIGSISFENDEVETYIENHFGIADNPAYGLHTVHTTFESGSRKTTYDSRFKEGSKGGAVFYKTVKTENYPDGLVCVYLTDDENSGIALNATYICDYKSDTSGVSHTFTISMPDVKNRSYAIIQDNYLVTVELTEDENVADSEELIYEETITAYDLNSAYNLNSVKQKFEIVRKIEPRDIEEMKEYQIKQGDSWWIYAFGYGRYTAEGATFISTEQEFCDKANELLKSISVENITLTKTSWNNRWFGTSIDESALRKNMVKVDFTTSEPVTLENGDVATEITIDVNGEKQELAEGQQLEKIIDEPVIYNQSTEEEQESIVMPDNIPSSVDVSSLQDLRYFNIDGFWYSSDLRYFYHIYTKTPDNGMGNMYFVDMKSGKEAKHGQVKQKSSYSVILKAMQDNVFSPEVFAAGNQLKSDEITLTRVSDSIVNNLIGTWSNDKVTYTFKEEGTYNVKTSNDSYYGFYFVQDENNIVLGKYVRDLKMVKYSISGNTLTINDSLVLTR